jgi:methylmalonyl-CoA mutase N-terminal domain/subunit
MAEPSWGMGPVSEPLTPLLWGRHLRYAALAVLCQARRPLGVSDLLARLEGHGFTVVGRRPAKTLADALGHEVALGRLRRTARGEYGIGKIAPRTRYRILARWRRSTPLPNLSAMASDERGTDSGIEIRPVYTAGDLEGWDPAVRLGLPGSYPYTRGIYPTMYRGKPWTMRQYSGFGTAAETNQRWKMLLANGSTGLSCAFDLPTQMGYDSDHPRADGEVGKVGVAIDSIEDMRLLLDGLPLDQITTSMTINATAAILLLLYQLVAEDQGVAPARLGGTIQNDILKEYIARGTYIYPPRPSMRLVTDIFAYCREYLPSWNTISISGYHIREAGSTAVQEIAFTLANGIAYVQAAVDAGLSVDEFAPRLSFFWNAHNNFFEEVAKYRAARRMWAQIMTERFGAKNDNSKLLRFHTQTGGSTLTAQQPENNIVRVTLQSLAAVLGGTQSLHTNGYDEAVGLPTERAARMALRTQQIIAAESGVVDTADPLAGSYFVEALTEQVEAGAKEYLEKIDGMGGAVAAIEAGFPQEEIEQAAYTYTKAVDAGHKVIVGVNKYVDEDPGSVEVFPIDPAMQAQQTQGVQRLRAQRDQAAVDAALAEVAAAARGTQNLLLPMKEALRRQATLGEVSDVLREAFGVYQPTR